MRVLWMERKPNVCMVLENIKPEWTLESRVAQAALGYFGLEKEGNLKNNMAGKYGHHKMTFHYQHEMGSQRSRQMEKCYWGCRHGLDTTRRHNVKETGTSRIHKGVCDDTRVPVSWFLHV